MKNQIIKIFIIFILIFSSSMSLALPSIANQRNALLEDLRSSTIFVKNDGKSQVYNIFEDSVYFVKTPVLNKKGIQIKYKNGQLVFNRLFWDKAFRGALNFARSYAPKSAVLQQAWNYCVVSNDIIKSLVKSLNKDKRDYKTKFDNGYFKKTSEFLGNDVVAELKAFAKKLNNTWFFSAGKRATRDLMQEVIAKLISTTTQILNNYNTLASETKKIPEIPTVVPTVPTTPKIIPKIPRKNSNLSTKNPPNEEDNMLRELRAQWAKRNIKDMTIKNR